MSPFPHSPAHPQQIDTRETHLDQAHDLRAPSSLSRRTAKARIARAVAAAGVCAAISTALATGGAPASAHPEHRGNRVSAQQFSREIRALERKGYVQDSCKLAGTEMRNPNTGQVVTVSL